MIVSPCPGCACERALQRRRLPRNLVPARDVRALSFDPRQTERLEVFYVCAHCGCERELTSPRPGNGT